MAVHMFMKVDDIQGESTDKDNPDKIEVLSWTWGMTQSGSAHIGSGTGTGKVTVQDLSFVKYVDKSTPVLMKYCCQGKFWDKAQLIVLKAGNNPVPYLTLDLTHGLVTSLTSGGVGADERLIETVTLNFKAFKIEYKPQNKGQGAAGIPASWDIAKNSES
jgi:type VI secretion system secreted protein Hcp